MGIDKKMMVLVGAIVVLAILVGAYFYLKPAKKPALPSAEEAAREVTEALPNIQTNPAEGAVPELNPVDKINPFRYENPLR